MGLPFTPRLGSRWVGAFVSVGLLRERAAVRELGEALRAEGRTAARAAARRRVVTGMFVVCDDTVELIIADAW